VQLGSLFGHLHNCVNYCNPIHTLARWGPPGFMLLHYMVLQPDGLSALWPLQSRTHHDLQASHCWTTATHCCTRDCAKRSRPSAPFMAMSSPADCVSLRVMLGVNTLLFPSWPPCHAITYAHTLRLLPLPLSLRRLLLQLFGDI